MTSNAQRIDDEDAPIDAAFVIEAMEFATATLAALPASGPRTGMKVSRLAVLDDNPMVYAHNDRGNRPAIPSAKHVSKMDEIFSWLAIIPENRKLLRRIVGARSFTTPHEGKPASWRGIGVKLGVDHRAVQKWHAQGIALIVAGLQKRGDL